MPQTSEALSPFSRFVDVDGIRTHYLDAGPADAPAVVLLHSGEFGGAAEISWEFNISALATQFRVVAPDWLGFGRTDKIIDFADRGGRVIRHMTRFCEVMGITAADFIGNSMGGSLLARIAATRPETLPIRSIVLASGGGAATDTPARRTLLAYDGSDAAMKALLRAMLHDPKWADDGAYVARRQFFALMPGAWECAAAPRLKPPGAPPRAQFGQADATPYEAIGVPALVIAGADDPLREKNYAERLAARIADAELTVFDACGHCPNIEHADAFNDRVLEFLAGIRRRG